MTAVRARTVRRARTRRLAARRATTRTKYERMTRIRTPTRAQTRTPTPTPIPTLTLTLTPALIPTLTSTLPAHPSTPNQVRAETAAACKPCEAGYACPPGAVEMLRCQPGSVTNLTAQATCRKCEAGTFQKNRARQECEASFTTSTLALALTLAPTRNPTLTLTLTLTLGLRARRLLPPGCVLAGPMRSRPFRQQDRSGDPARLLLL